MNDKSLKPSTKEIECYKKAAGFASQLESELRGFFDNGHDQTRRIALAASIAYDRVYKPCMGIAPEPGSIPTAKPPAQKTP